MILKIFTQPICPNCPPAKELEKQLSNKVIKQLRVESYNTTSVEGMAEAAFYQVMGTPTILLVDDKGGIVAEWRGKVPKKEEVLSKKECITPSR